MALRYNLALTLNDKERKVFKLAFPLKFKRKDAELIIIDRFSESRSINFEELDQFEQKSIDSDRFVLFEVHYAKLSKPKKMFLPQQVKATINGFTLFHSSVPKSKGHGTTKSIYEYYKRTRDLSYYTLIKKEDDHGNIKIKKLLLGSLLESDSRIHQIARVINQSFYRGIAFNRKSLEGFLSSNLSNRRVMKSVLDVLLAEGFLERSKNAIKTKKGRESETFVKTVKLEKFFIDPRSFLKPNGVNVGQRALTSDRNVVGR